MSLRRRTWDLAAGDELVPGRTVVGRLGDSLHCEVLLVWDARLCELAAAKVARPGWEDRTVVGILRREAELMSRLDHVVLPSCLDTALDGPRPHLLIERAEGPTLKALITRQGYLPLRHGLPLFARLADGLAHLADRGLVHADVSGENIVAGASPYLLDLGRAREVGQPPRRTKAHPGPYRAPEQCELESPYGPVGPRADVFGLGVARFFGLSGRRPWEQRRRDAEGRKTPVAQLTEPPGPLGRPLPRAVRRLLGRMLSRDPAGRPDAAQVAAELDEIAEHLARRATRARSTRRSAALEPLRLSRHL